MDTEQSLYDEIAYLNNQLSAAIVENDMLKSELSSAKNSLDFYRNAYNEKSIHAQKIEEQLVHVESDSRKAISDCQEFKHSFFQSRKSASGLLFFSVILCAVLLSLNFSCPWWQLLFVLLILFIPCFILCYCVLGLSALFLPNEPLGDTLPPFLYFPLLLSVYIVFCFIFRFLAFRIVL